MSDFVFHRTSQLPQVTENLVFGHIRWRRELGLPAGPLGQAFTFDCYSFQMTFPSADGIIHPTPAKLGRPVDAWEGPHDADHFRLSFMTFAVQPRGFAPGSLESTLNRLEIAFQDAMTWPATPGHDGIKILMPSLIDFNPPGQAQLLPDIKVFELPSSLVR